MTERTTTFLPSVAVRDENRAAVWGLYLAQHGKSTLLPNDFGLGRHPGRHRVEVIAGTCAEPVPTERPDTIPDRLPTRPDACTWRDHGGGVHFATVRLTPDPRIGLDGAHTDEMEVCRCCAFETDHIYEAMRSQARSNGHVEVALRQPTGEWI